MGAKKIGAVLRKARDAANYEVQEVSDILTKKGVRATVKTVYSWEQGRSQPKPDTLLMLCELYGIGDVLQTFGYQRNRPGQELLPERGRLLSLTPLEAALLEAYRKADGYDKTIVETALKKYLPPYDQPREKTPPPGEKPAPDGPGGRFQQPGPRPGDEAESSERSISIAARGGGGGTKKLSEEQVDAALSELQKLEPDGQDL